MIFPNICFVIAVAQEDMDTPSPVNEQAKWARPSPRLKNVFLDED